MEQNALQLDCSMYEGNCWENEARERGKYAFLASVSTFFSCHTPLQT